MTTFGINNFLGNKQVSNAFKGFDTFISSGARSPLHRIHTMLGGTMDAMNFVKDFQRMDGIGKIGMLAKMILGGK